MHNTPPGAGVESHVSCERCVLKQPNLPILDFFVSHIRTLCAVFSTIDVTHQSCQSLPQDSYHVVTNVASVFTLHSMSGLPIMCKYNYHNTMPAQSGANSPILLEFSGVNGSSSMLGVSTSSHADALFPVNSQSLSTRVSASPARRKSTP